MFYDKFIRRCEEAGISPSNVLTECGIGRAGLKRWREGQDPSNPTKKKIADYFGITVRELTTDDTEKASAQKTEADEMNDMLEEIRRRPELKTLFSLSSKATTDDVNTTIKIIQALKGGNMDE